VSARGAAALVGCVACVAAFGAGASHAETAPIGRHVEISLARPVVADVARTGRAAGRVAAEAPRRRWITRLPFRRPHAPLRLDDGALVVAGAGGIAVVEPDGRERWRREIPSVVSAPARSNDGDILVVTDTHQLLRFSPAGEPREPTPSTPAVDGAPLVMPRGVTFVGSRAGRVYVLAPDGALLREVATAHRGVVRFVALDDGRVATAGGDPVLSFVSLHVGLERALPLHEAVAAGPVRSDDGTLWVVGQYGTLWRVPPDGEARTVARLEARAQRPPPAIGRDGDLWVGGADLQRIAPSGRLRWRRTLDAIAGPITLDDDDTAIVVTGRGTLVAFDRDGRERWRTSLGEHASPRPVLGPDGTLYVAMPSGRLSAWR